MRRLFRKNVLHRSNTAIIVGFIVVFMAIFSLNLVPASRIFGYAGTTTTTSSSSSAPVCGDTRPASAPDLFQINVSGNTAKLFFTPISNTGEYYISFSTKPIAEENGAQVTLAKEGVQNFTVRELKFNTAYYFKVRGQIGCMPGDWSNIMKATTRTKFLTQAVAFFKNSILKPILTFIANTFKPATQNTVVTPSPILAPQTQTVAQPTIAPQPVGVPVTQPIAPKVSFWQRILNFFTGK